MSYKYEEPQALNSVADFHRIFKLPILAKPNVPHEDRCKLRINLLQEELDELKDAIKAKDITEIADALADIQYVLSGAILEFGLGDHFKRLFDEVQRSNMSKVCDNLKDAEDTIAFYRSKDGTEGYIEESDGKFMVYRQADHKVLKSVNYSAADLDSVLLMEP
ncbi:MAG: nucleoside triphosphate pyrophosphohydrolase family protein [Saprospiraceae bacterium]|jgi:predicted HAD superfamily Cof-like phosphohydrolase|nr:nucleoside triphosphate pyrophosphohydrolase family protein [Saprospiraceae bacterium]